MDDAQYWLDLVLDRKKNLQTALKHPVEILSRSSANEALAVVEGKDQRMTALAGQGHGLNVVILDLMMDGGKPQDVAHWVKAVCELNIKSLPQRVLKDIDDKCPAVPVGRKAAANDLKVIILTNVDNLVHNLDIQKERRLIMAACGASAFIVKTSDTWLKELVSALSV